MIRFERATRRSWLRSTPTLAAAAIVSLGLLSFGLARRLDVGSTCVLRRTTGIPCPTCGTTRAGLAMLELKPARALALNPLTTGLGVAFTLWSAAYLSLGRRAALAPAGTPSRARARARLLFTLALLALAANWAYVVASQG